MSDGQLTDQETIGIEVLHTNAPPVLGSIGAQSVNRVGNVDSDLVTLQTLFNAPAVELNAPEKCHFVLHLHYPSVN